MGNALLKAVENNLEFCDGLDGFLDIMDDQATIDSVWPCFLNYSKAHRVDAVAYYHMPPAGALDFEDRDFISIGYIGTSISLHKDVYNTINSPLTNRSRTLRQPTFWSRVFETLDLNESEESHFRDYYYMGDSHNGIVIPVHGPDGRNGCVVLRFKDNFVRLNRNEVRRLKWAAQAAHERYCVIKSKQRNSTIALTRREQEIMTWVARGKSNSVIAEIMGLSRHTVNGYLRRIFLKTTTSDRTTATLRALGESLIDF